MFKEIGASITAFATRYVIDMMILSIFSGWFQNKQFHVTAVGPKAHADLLIILLLV